MQGARNPALGLWLPPALVLAGIVAVTCAFAVLERNAFYALIRESGAVETATALLYAVLMGALLMRRIRLALGLIPFCLAALLLAREMDHYLRFNTRSIFSGRLYTDPLTPLALKILLLAVFAALIAATVVFLIRIAPKLIAAMRARSPFLVPLAWAAVLIGLSPVLDRASRHIQDLFAVTLSDAASLYLAGLEETAELLIPAMLLVALWQGLAQRAEGLRATTAATLS